MQQAQRVSHGANSFLVHGKPDALPIAATQPVASRFARWVAV